MEETAGMGDSSPDSPVRFTLVLPGSWIKGFAKRGFFQLEAIQNEECCLHDMFWKRRTLHCLDSVRREWGGY